MGQTLGKASFCEASKPFVNLSGLSVRKLWQSFQVRSAGFFVGLAASLPLVLSALKPKTQVQGPQNTLSRHVRLTLIPSDALLLPTTPN